MKRNTWRQKSIKKKERKSISWMAAMRF